ncbi:MULTISPECIES: PhoPQ-activated pathogenicity-related family protein [unclassified Thermotoga]|uniref:PhoPQ-activated pathogenicity-related family protein n=1 Tax=unclassified Thermotoga TaxID=2631113 RepID=UPI000540E838|nr:MULTISPECIES: PhoPQ-activated protein PqaA family protein [unclassified Thermotoga]AIY89046.1 PhoPQ-activated pathogenicity-like protein [Thermotoga sp. Cell2]KHC93217.1 PhoPQ-activated pathogenicity-like protein [Thermotoga sp. TBGT1765]KHC94625.1 PhoPQ-activated pathogenicity-like protein [Thermotoga sp. TBGT1766]KHC95932.1 PhoPQ-activated pathogenicity-like protein [Thermotoga sp. Xyl54]
MKKATSLIMLILTATIFAVHPLDVLTRERGTSLYETKISTTTQEGEEIYVLKSYGMKWQEIQWFHRVGIILPSNLRYKDRAFLLITGGSRKEENEGYYRSFLEDVLEYLWVARMFESPFVVVGDVPNQPIFGLREDALIAETFRMYLEKPDPYLPLLVPMTYGVIKAMDTAQDFLEKKGFEIKGFMVSGASKRGWTTYLTAIFDPRIFAIAPMVYDNLNIEAQLLHQKEYYGTYSEKLKDYQERGLLDLIENEQGKELLEIVDPYAMRLKLDLPKVLVLGTNDEYWTVDSANLYVDDLPGETFLFYSPNDRHSLKNIKEIVETVSSFFKLYPNLPKVEFHYDNGKIFVEKEPEIVDAELWFARSKSRDFREAVWFRKSVEENGDSLIGVPPEKPEGFYQAYFLRVVLDIGGLRMKVCSKIVVE